MCCHETMLDGNFRAMNGSRVVSKMWTYSGASIIPSNIHSGAGTFTLIAPQTCTLTGCFGLCCGKITIYQCCINKTRALPRLQFRGLANLSAARPSMSLKLNRRHICPCNIVEVCWYSWHHSKRLTLFPSLNGSQTRQHSCQQ